MSKVKVAALAALAALMLALLSVALWRAPLPLAPQSFAGTYVSFGDGDISWVTITEKTQAEVTCVWSRVLNDKGTLKRQQASLEGTQSGDRLTLSARIAGIPPIAVSAAALREGATIRMSLSRDNNVFYTGRYEPSDERGAAAAVAQFKRDAIAATPQAEAHVQKLSSDEDKAEEKRQRLDTQMKVIKQGNSYILRVRGFIEQSKATEAEYKKNTQRIKGYIENVRRAEETGNMMARDHMLEDMREMAADTKEKQEGQEDFIREYTDKIVPFANSLPQLQKDCARGQPPGDKRGNEDMCSVFLRMQKALYTGSQGVEQAVKVLTTTYEAEYAAQLKIIEDTDNKPEIK